MKRMSGSRVFKRYLLSYIIILMVPVLIGVYAYNKTVGVIVEEAKKANLSVLGQSKETLDIRLKEIEQIATELSVNPKIIHLANVDPPFSDQEYYQIHEVLMDIKKYNLNQFITDYYLHFPKSELLITRRTMYELPNSYGTFFRYGDLEYKEWIEQMAFDGRLNRYFSAEDLYYNGTHQNMMTFQKMIFPGYSKVPSGSIFIVFPEEEIAKMLGHLGLEDGGWAYILDDRGQVLYGTTPEETWDAGATAYRNMTGEGNFYHEHQGERMLVSYTTSTYNDWTYVAALPEKTVFARANYIKRITLSVTIVSLFIGLLLAMMLARRNSQPIRELMETVKEFIKGEQPVKGNDYEVIKGTVKQLIHRHNDLKDSLDQHIPFLQLGFFERLFKGDFKDGKELQDVAGISRIALVGNTFVVMSLRFSGFEGLISREILEDMNRQRMIVKQALHHMKECHVLIHPGHNDTLTILLDLDVRWEQEDLQEKLKQSASQLEEILRKEAGISLAIGIGGMYNQALDIWKSANESRQALEYADRTDRMVVWHAEIPLESNLYYYPMDLEMRLIHTVHTGNREGLVQLLEHIGSENLEKRRLTDTVLRQLVNELYGTLLKIIESTRDAKKILEDWMFHPDPAGPVLDDYGRIKQSLLQVCLAVEQAKQDQSVLLKNRMIDYVESNFSKYTISLSDMASHFRLSESYASTFFKEHTGENFSVYLESVRMREARKLLAGTTESINDIADRIGYNSDKTFRRAFKRYHGVLPTAYRSHPPDRNDLLAGEKTIP